MKGPSAVLALVLAETAAGSAAFLWLAPLWGTVKRGFFVLTGAVVAVLALSAAGAASAATDTGAASGPVWSSFVLAGLAALWTLLLVFRLDRPGRWVGLASVPVAVWNGLSFVPSAESAPAAAGFQLVAGAGFMGAVLVGLLLGHWYLTDRRLSRGPIMFFAYALLVAVALEVVAVAMEGFADFEAGSQFSSLLSATGVGPLLALGMVLATGLIAVMIRLTLRGDRPAAVQAATGFFYLAVITGFAGELAAKIRFLPQA